MANNKPKTVRAKDRAVESNEKLAESLAEEYRYVVVDLKRIAVLALAMLALLVVLAFVLT